MSAVVEAIPAANVDGELDRDMKDAAEDLKAKGNAAFAARQYATAIDHYSDAVEALMGSRYKALLGVLYCNRSFCNLRLENYGTAITDASTALELNAANAKAYYRRASGYLALHKLREAAKDFKTVTRILPSDPDAKKKLAEVEKLIFQERFSSAISTEVIARASESIDLRHMSVSASYEGPALPDSGEVSSEFVHKMLSWFKQERKLSLKTVFQIALQAISIFEKMRALEFVDVADSSEFILCGDVHGQFYDLALIFETYGFPTRQRPYLFNGDFVDRGNYSLECILTLLALKVMDPQCIYLNRGNHETSNMNRFYGFFEECKDKYNEKVYHVLSESFRLLPLVHILRSSAGEQVMCVHGGVPATAGVTLKNIMAEDRNCEPGDTSVLTELLWSDPMPGLGRAPSKRGVSCQFGPDVTKAFCDLNNIKLVVRAHEMKMDGYEWAHDNRLVTVFSAPNYCGTMGNLGAVLRMKTSATGVIDPTEIMTFKQSTAPQASGNFKYLSALYRQMM